MSSTGILKLGIRANTYPRDVTIKLTLRSLILVAWLSSGIILLYEVLSTWMILLQSSYNYNGSRNSNDADYVILIPYTKTDKSSITLISKPPPPRLSVVILWGIATAYGIFYSFEVMFFVE